MITVPFINTMLDNGYRVFILREFFQKDILENFKGWSEKDMIGWTKFFNHNDKVTFEFYGKGNSYKIKNPKLIEKSFTLPYPMNLDQFICDCHRCFVDLQWGEDIVEEMNRIVFMDQSNIHQYNKKLLTKIDKA